MLENKVKTQFFYLKNKVHIFDLDYCKVCMYYYFLEVKYYASPFFGL